MDQGTGNREQGSGYRDQGSGIRDQGTGIRDQTIYCKPKLADSKKEMQEKSLKKNPA